MLHAIGAKKTAHTPGIPVNPISLQYECTPKGDHQVFNDEKRRLNQLVRAHNLQTQGTSGYNPINGRASMHVENQIPQQAQQIF